jgi:chorismate--pyruvate lyase
MKMRNRKTRGRDRGGWPAFLGESGPTSAWLRETGSLTARLRQSGLTTMQLLHQGMSRPGRDERRVLSLRLGRLTTVREVVLHVDDHVVVYAHTVANPAALKLLRRAGRRPLATVLFTDPKVKAGPLHYRRLDARHPLSRAATPWCAAGLPSRLPARRALFARGAARLLVTEVFLPRLSTGVASGFSR